MPEVTITHPDGSTETIPKTVGYSWRRKIGEMTKLTIDVVREDAQAVTLNKKSDEIELAGVTTARLVDVNTGGATHTLICYGFSWDGKTVEPTPSGVVTSDTDDALVTQFVGDVGTWTAGNINQIAGGLTLVSNHAQPHERLRKLEQKTAGELRFNPDKSVDYVASLGTDKTGSVTLAPGNANLEGEITVENRGRKIDATHIKVIGAHEGEAQYTANLVPASDGRSYPNRVDYTTDRWADSSDDDWDRWFDREAATQSEVETIAASLGEDIQNTHIEASATAIGEDLALGDMIHVTKPKADIDRDMRIIEIITETLGKHPATVVDKLTLSTRTTARDTEQKRLRDNKRLQTAYMGSSVSVQGGGSRQPVDSGVNAEIPFDYPDLEYENDVSLQVRGLPYRAYSQGAASGGGDFVTSEDDGGVVVTSGSSAPDAENANPSTYFYTDTGTKTIGENYPSLPVGVDSGVGQVYVLATYIGPDDGDSGFLEITIENTDTNTTLYTDNFVETFNQGQTKQYAVVETGDTLSGDNLEVTVNITDIGGSSAFAISYGATLMSDHAHAIDIPDHAHDVDIPEHTHDPDPGVIEFFSNTPSNVDVIVNGTTVATDIGSGAFETEVDLSGELDRDQWNMIELTSDTLGHIQASVSLDGYKQIGKQ